MTILKWTWKIIWRCVFIPAIFTLIVMIISMFFINDSNQTEERAKAIEQNYGTSYQRNNELASENPNFVTKYNQYSSSGDRRYVAKTVEMQDSDFDLTAIIAMIALFGSLIVMIIYTISDIRDFRKHEKIGT